MPLGALLAFNKKNKAIFALAIVCGTSFFGASCSKQDSGTSIKEGTVFVRIKQVDKDGTESYSKVIKVVKP